MGIDDRTLYDNLGRATETIQDYTDGVETADSNITTEYGYDGNDNTIYVRADEPGGLYQQTNYVYGVTTASGSGVNSNDILSTIEYPDPSTGQPSTSSNQEETYLVNALGQTVQYTDRNGNVHQYTYDVLGRLTSDAVTTLGTGVDGSVRRIEYGYDSQGNLSLITSYDAASGGNIVNQVLRQYNGLDQLTAEYQGHHGAVDTSQTGTIQTSVQYVYNEMSNGENNSRLVSIIYPSTYYNARYTLTYNYDSGLDDSISRLSSLSDNSTLSNGYILESYKYLGVDTVVERDHPQTDVNQTYISQNGQTGDAGDKYVGLDRFGRVVNDNWVNASTGQSTDDFAYGYNADGDVLYKQNLVDSAMSELYQYNSLDELINFQRGTLNSTDDGIVGTPSESQSWSPDALGNFNSVTTNGSTQTRTANQQNEITTISGSGSISYDGNGNLTADGSGNTYVYDAWDRLVTVQNNGTTAASYAYDGLGRQITQTNGSNTRELYYSADGQVLTEWYDGLEQARNVWSPVYVNGLVVRDQARVDNGVLNDRFYVQQDANGNVTALVTAIDNLVERYDYDAYGVQTVLNANFSVRGTSNYNVPYGFQGMRADSTVGLNFADNRVYDPTLMRWLQTDPIGLNAGNNDYEFVGDGPTDRVDPSGLTWDDLVNLFRYPSETAAGIAAGARNLAIGAKDFGAEVMYTAVDTSALMGQTMLSKVGIERDYTPRSSFYQGLAITPQPGAYLLEAGGQMARSGVTLGGANILDAIHEFEQTGDATKPSQKLGGVALGNLSAAAVGKLNQASRKPPSPCVQPGSVLTPKLNLPEGKIGLSSLSEAEAASILQEIEAANNAAGVNSHFFSKHGAQTTLLQQARRARFGTLPDGSPGNPAPASRFLTHHDQLSALLRAMEKSKLPGNGPNTPLFYDRIIGEGYLQGGGKVNYVVTGGVIYVFRNGRLLTLYPLVR